MLGTITSEMVKQVEEVERLKQAQQQMLRDLDKEVEEARERIAKGSFSTDDEEAGAYESLASALRARSWARGCL